MDGVWGEVKEDDWGYDWRRSSQKGWRPGRGGAVECRDRGAAQDASLPLQLHLRQADLPLHLTRGREEDTAREEGDVGCGGGVGGRLHRRLSLPFWVVSQVGGGGPIRDIHIKGMVSLRESAPIFTLLAQTI
jgi:hypothetical protein